MSQLGNFLDMLNEAADLVRQKFPGAQFYEADLALNKPGSGWRFVFNVPAAEGGSCGTDVNTTAIINNTLGEFGPVDHICQPFLEDRVIPLPIHLDLEEAMALAESQGCGSGQPQVINLRWALYPGVDEPQYILSYKDARAFVGVYTHKVQCSPAIETGFRV